MEEREGVRFTKDSFGALIITAAGELTKAEKDPANKTPSGHFPEITTNNEGRIRGQIKSQLSRQTCRIFHLHCYD